MSVEGDVAMPMVDLCGAAEAQSSPFQPRKIGAVRACPQELFVCDALDVAFAALRDVYEYADFVRVEGVPSGDTLARAVQQEVHPLLGVVQGREIHATHENARRGHVIRPCIALKPGARLGAQLA